MCHLLYLQPVTNLSFVGTSTFLMSLCQSSRPQIALWNVSNLSMLWSYSIYAEGTNYDSSIIYAFRKAKILSGPTCLARHFCLSCEKNTICSSDAYMWIMFLIHACGGT